MTKTLQHYHDACGRLAIDRPVGLDLPVAGLTNDSRLVNPGDLFIAIVGARDDGRKYIADAVARGACGIVHRGDAALELPVPSWRVSDDYMALGRLAECHYDQPALKLRFAGITGTNGKTTTAFLLRDILRTAGERTGLIGTVHYEIGDREITADRTTPTPLELQALLAEMAAAALGTVVMEVSSHALWQRRMGTLLFDAGVFTNLSGDHLDYHSSMDEYFETKKRLFTEYMTDSGTPVINIDDAWGRRLADDLSGAVTFGTADAADCRVIEHTSTLRGSEVTYTWQGVDDALAAGRTFQRVECHGCNRDGTGARDSCRTRDCRCRGVWRRARTDAVAGRCGRSEYHHRLCAHRRRPRERSVDRETAV